MFRWRALPRDWLQKLQQKSENIIRTVKCTDDLPRHFTERPDLPRTLYSAFCSYETETLDDALKTASPCHLISQMPDIPYTVFHCDKDQDVSKSLHSDRFVAEMRNQHKNITYYAVPGRGHCELTDEMAEKYYAAIVSAISQ